MYSEFSHLKETSENSILDQILAQLSYVCCCYDDHQANNNGRIHPPNDEEKLADLANDRL